MFRSSPTKTRPQFSLRLTLCVPLIAQTFVAVGLVGYFSYRNGEKAVNDLAEQLIERTSQQVEEHLSNHLSIPLKVAQMNAEAIKNGSLAVDDRRQRERYFWAQAKAFPELGYIGHVNTTGLEQGAGNWIKDVGIAFFESVPGKDGTSIYSADAKGNRQYLLQTFSTNALTEPYYTDVIANNKLAWTRIYTIPTPDAKVTSAGDKLHQTNGVIDTSRQFYTAISAGAPVYNRQGKLLGTTNADLTLLRISDFLQRLKASPTGHVFILERNGSLVASSSQHPILYKTKDNAARHTIENSPDPIIRSVGKAIVREFENLNQITGKTTFQVSINGAPKFIRVENWRDQYGVDWLTVMVVPETDFMAQIHANRQTTLLLSAATFIVTLALGHYTADLITRTIERLQAATNQMAQGYLDQPMQPSRLPELNALGNDFNHMAQQLKQSFTALEQNNIELEQRVNERTAALQVTLEDLQRTQLQMVQSEKMSALGQMVAGIAHEINNPTSFIHGNLKYLKHYTHDLLEVVNAYQREHPVPSTQLATLLDDLDLEFIKTDVQKLLDSAQLGTTRIKEIVLSMRNFSRLDEADRKLADVHDGIESALVILQHRLKAAPEHPAIVVRRDYGNLPDIECYPGYLNQVVMNILSNAIDAIEENTPEQAEIQIRTRTVEHSGIVISIRNNGGAIPAHQRSQIFDPFFTTKPVGKGTGLGLSISYQVITEKHNGRIYAVFPSEHETEFVIELPLQLSQSPTPSPTAATVA